MIFRIFAHVLIKSRSMTVKTRAIVLHSVRYGDNQLIVDFFTEAMGRLSFIVRLAKSAKAKMKRQYFQPLSILNIEFDHRPSLSLQRLKDIGISLPYADMLVNPYKISMTLFLSEFLYYSTRNEQNNIPLFQFLVNSMEWLDMAPANFSNFHLVLMMHLTLFLGFAPNMEIDAKGRYFDLMEGKFVPFVPTHSHYLSEEDSGKMRTLMRLRYQTMHLYTMSRHERNKCVEVILSYYQLHLPAFPELKTLPILKELFG